MTSLNQWWPSLLSQYDATWLQWVNDACEWRPWFLCHLVWQSIGPFFYVINLWKCLAYVYPNFLGFSLHCYFWNSFSYSYHLHIFKAVSISIWHQVLEQWPGLLKSHQTTMVESAIYFIILHDVMKNWAFLLCIINNLLLNQFLSSVIYLNSY